MCFLFFHSQEKLNSFFKRVFMRNVDFLCTEVNTLIYSLEWLHVLFIS